MLKTFLCACVAFSLSLSSVQAHPKASENYERVLQGDSSYVLLFAFPSAAYLDWSSPTRLTWTSLHSTIAKRSFGLPTTIGHAQFAWHCQSGDGNVLASGASGQSGERHGQSLKVLRDGWGMSLLELVYNDGVLESTEDVKDRVAQGAATHQFSWVGFQVSTSQCLAMADYVKAFAKAKAYKNYGFPVDPLKLEGGGCTSYTHAAVQKSGIPLGFKDRWLRTYPVSLEHLGRHENLPAYTRIVSGSKIPDKAKYVSLTDFLFGDQQWAKANAPQVPFRYYDPELFYESFLHLENAYRRSERLPLRQAVRTDQLDNYQQELKRSTEAWYQTHVNQERAVRLDQIHGKTGVIMDLR